MTVSQRGTAAAVLLPAAQTEPPAARFRLRQSFRYDYDGPATDLLHRLVVVPPVVHGDQRLRFGSVTVSDASCEVQWRRDRDGNQHCAVRLARVPRRLQLDVSVVLDRSGTAGELPADAVRDPRWLGQSPLTRADPTVRRLAAEHGRGPQLAAAERLCALVHERIAYSHDATSVRTTAAQALAGGAGVCQDHAHVLLALCRAAGIACRYVSGHLVGEGGTHAWTEVLVRQGRSTRVVALDPCHGRRAQGGYVTVAVGRDYRDVPPTSGWYAGPARGRLTASKTLTSEPLAA